jgi:hypothetical protein
MTLIIGHLVGTFYIIGIVTNICISIMTLFMNMHIVMIVKKKKI